MLDKKECFEIPLELIEYILLQDGCCQEFPVTIFQIMRCFNRRIYDFSNLNLQRFIGHYVRHINDHNYYSDLYELCVYPIIGYHVKFSTYNINNKHIETSLFYKRKNNYPTSVRHTGYYTSDDDPMIKNNKNNIYYINPTFNTLALQLQFDKYYLKNVTYQNNNIIDTMQLLEFHECLATYIYENDIFKLNSINYNEHFHIGFAYHNNGSEFQGIIFSGNIYEPEELYQFFKNGYFIENDRGKYIIDYESTRTIRYNKNYIIMILKLYEKYKNINDFIQIKFEDI